MVSYWTGSAPGPTESHAPGVWCGHADPLLIGLLSSLRKPSASADLIKFLQSLPDGRKRRGVRYPQWLLLLMAIIGILSGCRSDRDLERLAKRGHQECCSALGMELPKAP